MASPFTIFRKHQKIMIATLGLLAMIAFVFLPIILKGLDSRSVQNPVVVETNKYGDLHERQLQGMLRQRQMVVNFLQRAVSMAAGQPVRPEWIEQQFGSISEESVVDTWILANHAKDLGMKIGDSVINRFIKEVTADRVTAYEIKTILKNLRITQKQLFEALRTELLARYFQQMFFPSLQGTPPAQRWDYYRRLNRRATVQLVPVPVAKYVGEIPDPDEATLRDFFEKHKNDYPSPTSPEPGFHEPAKINVQYFKAEHDKFVDPAQVTDEEIQLYYDQVKDRDYLDIQLPDLGEEETEPTPETKPAEKPAKESTPEKKDGEKSAEATPPEKKDAEKSAKKAPATQKEAKKPAKEEPAKEEGKQPSQETPAKEEATKPPQKTPSEKKDAQEDAKKASEKKEDMKGTPGDKEDKKSTSAVENRSPIRLVSMANETQPQEADTPAEPAKDVAKKEADASAEGKPAETKYIPLKKVEKEIRGRLAEEHATTRIEDKLAPLREKMADFHDKWILAEALKDEDPSARKKIKKLDFAALAKENGLQTEKTGLVTQLEAYQFDIGKSVIDEQVPFVRFAFEGLPLYRPAISRDLEGNWYLFWKIEEIEDNVPEFEDEGVREKVLAAWKMVQARAKAREAAEELATQAREEKKSLKDLYAGQPDLDVLEPSPFSWLTQGAVPTMASYAPPRLSEVEGVTHPGPEFMREVFSLEDGKITVAMNQPETFAYVVQMEDLKPTTRVLWELFQADDYGKYAAAAAPDQQRILRAWRDEILESAGLEWARDPIRPGQR